MSSVSVWVRDVELTAEQHQKLLEREPRLEFYKQASADAREVRRHYQEAGRAQARQGNPLHLAGCMLHWAEGTKHRNTVKLTNSDPEMVGFFLKFLRQCYGIGPDRIMVSINCFTDSGLSLEEIQQYWLMKLELPESCMRTCTVNTYSKYSAKKRKGKLKYGVLAVRVHSTEVMQSIYGAIQEYAGFDNPAWLF